MIKNETNYPVLLSLAITLQNELSYKSENWSEMCSNREGFWTFFCVLKFTKNMIALSTHNEYQIIHEFAR